MSDTLTDPRRPVTAPCTQAILEDATGSPFECDVCGDTGEVLDAPGRGGREVLPCLNCDAYDRRLQADADAAEEARADR